METSPRPTPIEYPAFAGSAVTPSVNEDAAQASRTAGEAWEQAHVDSMPMAASFIEQAERAERWQRPEVRRTLVLACLSALLLLGLQAAFEFRSLIAARWPHTAPVLRQICDWAGCKVDALRQIESLIVDSSGLVRIDGTALYRLSVVLRNSAPLELAPPSLDLTLTDAQGKVISRRVLSLAELGAPLSSISAGAEVPIQVALNVGERQVSGYTVELFYP